MLPSEESFFKNGRVNKEALVDFIKTIKKNTNLSDEDAAIMAASKVSKKWTKCFITIHLLLASMLLEVVKGFRWLITNPIIPQNAGGRQPSQVEDVVPDQRHEEHDRGEEDPTKPEDERQDERGGKSEVLKKTSCIVLKQNKPIHM